MHTSVDPETNVLPGRAALLALGRSVRDWACIVVPGLVLFVGALSPASASPPGPGVTVETSRRVYMLGDVVQITVTNLREEAVFLPGCEGYQLERFAEDAYEPLPRERCDREGPALAVPTGTHVFEYHPGRAELKQLLRVSLVFGWGCTEGRALSSARCTDFATVRSASFRLSNRPE